jgi:S-adenosylmethionine uptake transporter
VTERKRPGGEPREPDLIDAAQEAGIPAPDPTVLVPPARWHQRLKARATGLSAPWLMVIAAFMFASMSVCVKLAAADYSTGEIMIYRGLVGIVMMAVLAHSRGESLKTSVPATHVRRSVTGVVAMFLWFYCVARIPLATAMTLNYMSSVWIAVFMLVGAFFFGKAKVDKRLIVSVLLGFGGVALVLQPTIGDDQIWYGLVGMMSGMISATAYLQIAALARAGEAETRIVFYFSIACTALGVITALPFGFHAVTWKSALLLLAVGLLAGLAQVLMTRAYAIGKMLVNASLQYLGIAFAALYGVLLFADPMSWSLAAGMAMIVGAGIFAALLKSKPATKKAH